MSFKYVNPGYGELLIPYSSSYPISTVESEVYNPANGVAISQEGSYAELKLDSPLGADLYGKFDLYYVSSMSNFRIGSFISTSSGNWSWFCGFGGYDSSGVLRFYMQSTSGVSTGMTLNKDAINTVWFHIHNTGARSDGGDNFYELIVGGEKISRAFTYAYPFNQSYKALELRLGSGIYVSNLVLSDEYIGPKEEVVVLPVSGVETDMTDNGDGTYAADDEGQVVLQTVDASELITRYGSKSKVNGIVPLAVPAYKTAAGLSNLVSIERSEGLITEHSSIALSTGMASGISDYWPANLTIEALGGRQIGWKAATQ